MTDDIEKTRKRQRDAKRESRAKAATIVIPKCEDRERRELPWRMGPGERADPYRVWLSEIMLQQTQAEDYVIATGHQYSVRTFVTRAAECLGIQVGWRGQGLEEHAIDKATGRTVVRIDPRYFRPTEVDTLLGDASKAKRQLGWTPEVSFEDLVSEMVESDSKLAERDALIQREGFNVYKHRE